MKPLLIDLDGVLRVRNKPINDLNKFLSFIENKQIPACILSNSSTSSSQNVKEFFNKYSIQLSLPILTAIDAARVYISEKYRKVAVYVSENIIDQFADYLEFENPEAVLVGDIGDAWNYKLMQTIFDYIRNGAELIAAHKNKFWEKSDLGIQLDAGPFIHAIEYAASVEATLIGKPSPIYFEAALKRIGFDLSDPFLMIGDDLDTDIVGAKNLGAETILIYTGKTSPPVDSSYRIVIDHEANTLSDVINIMAEL